MEFEAKPKEAALKTWLVYSQKTSDWVWFTQPKEMLLSSPSILRSLLIDQVIVDSDPGCRNNIFITKTIQLLGKKKKENLAFSGQGKILQFRSVGMEQGRSIVN